MTKCDHFESTINVLEIILYNARTHIHVNITTTLNTNIMKIP